MLKHAARPENERVTMATIARIAGVTQPTVSRAFNHPDKLSPETLGRIMEAVRATGYVPNLVAGALASNRSRTLAAIVPSITNIVYSSLLQPFIAKVRADGYQTMVLESGLSEEEEEKLVLSALSRRPEGILLTGVHHSRECRRQLMLAGIPVVEVWDITESPIDICAGFSHTDAARDAARHLLSLGYRKLAVISANDTRARLRCNAFCDAVRVAGAAAPVVEAFDGTASLRLGRQGFAALAERGFREGAVFCSSDMLAHGVMIEAKVRGIDVPHALGVLGFGDQDFASELVPPLSSINVNRQRLGEEAATALIAAMNSNERPKSVINIGYTFKTRGSLQQQP
jgi:LacI family transcriptional regulator, gluconate utilization system Gnt-I transcriptional repressor